MDKTLFQKLHAREVRLQKAQKRAMLSLLKTCGGRITFIPASKGDEYPVPTTLYGQHDFPRIDISDIYLSEDGRQLLADGFETEEGFRERRYGFGIGNEHLSDAFAFICQTIKF